MRAQVLTVQRQNSYDNEMSNLWLKPAFIFSSKVRSKYRVSFEKRFISSLNFLAILTYFHINTSETSRWDNVQLKIQLYRVPEFSLGFLAQMLLLRWSNNNVQSLTCSENSNETKLGVFSNSRLVKHRHNTFKQGLYSDWDRRDHHAVYGFDTGHWQELQQVNSSLGWLSEGCPKPKQKPWIWVLRGPEPEFHAALETQVQEIPNLWFTHSTPALYRSSETEGRIRSSRSTSCPFHEPVKSHHINRFFFPYFSSQKFHTGLDGIYQE